MDEEAEAKRTKTKVRNSGGVCVSVSGEVREEKSGTRVWRKRNQEGKKEKGK